MNITGRFYGEKMNLCVKKQDYKLVPGFFTLLLVFSLTRTLVKNSLFINYKSRERELFFGNIDKF